MRLDWTLTPLEIPVEAYDFLYKLLTFKILPHLSIFNPDPLTMTLCEVCVCRGVFSRTIHWKIMLIIGQVFQCIPGIPLIFLHFFCDRFPWNSLKPVFLFKLDKVTCKVIDTFYHQIILFQIHEFNDSSLSTWLDLFGMFTRWCGNFLKTVHLGMPHHLSLLLPQTLKWWGRDF